MYHVFDPSVEWARCTRKTDALLLLLLLLLLLFIIIIVVGY
jgi:hypothetical protein